MYQQENILCSNKSIYHAIINDEERIKKVNETKI